GFPPCCTWPTRLTRGQTVRRDPSRGLAARAARRYTVQANLVGAHPVSHHEVTSNQGTPMSLDAATILPQLGQVLTRYYVSTEGPKGLEGLSGGRLEELFTLLVHTLECFAPPASIFHKRMKAIVEDERCNFIGGLEALAGILRGVQA